jgi:uncharacterized membrane protein YdbT with pleckstrin-like domain
MSYIQDNLMPNEKILFSARTSPAIFIQPIFAFVMTVAMFLVGIFMASQPTQSNPQVIDIGATLRSTMSCFIFLFSFAFFIASVILGVQNMITILTTEFAVTDRRVIAKTGFVRRHTLEIFLSKIESVAVRQTWLGRLLDVGTVTVTGTGGTRESFPAIANPIGVRKKINQVIEKYAVKP